MNKTIFTTQVRAFDTDTIDTRNPSINHKNTKILFNSDKSCEEINAYVREDRNAIRNSEHIPYEIDKLVCMACTEEDEPADSTKPSYSHALFITYKVNSVPSRQNSLRQKYSLLLWSWLKLTLTTK